MKDIATKLESTAGFDNEKFKAEASAGVKMV